MAKAKSLLDDVRAGIAERDRKRSATWFDLLEADTARELADIKAQWRAGKLQTTKTTLAKLISAALQPRGVTVGFLGVLRWLERQ
jgi:hypothetical protein